MNKYILLLVLQCFEEIDVEDDLPTKHYCITSSRIFDATINNELNLWIEL